MQKLKGLLLDFRLSLYFDKSEWIIFNKMNKISDPAVVRYLFIKGLFPKEIQDDFYPDFSVSNQFKLKHGNLMCTTVWTLLY